MKQYIVCIIVLLAGCIAMGGSSSSDIQVSDTYIGLRDLAFNNFAEELNDTDVPETYGVIMDMGLSKGYATIASFYTGDASLYASGGGGILGGITHKDVADSSKEFVKVSNNYVRYMEKVSNHPLPKRGEVIFYVLTKNGVYMAKDTDENLNEGKSQFSPMFVAGNNLITEMRKISS